jgi:hypothetical protein
MLPFASRPKKQPKVIRKKLGKEQAWGTWDEPKNIIEIDERLKGKKELIIYLHEYFHKLFPDLSEEIVIIKSELLADFLWKNHFRKVDLGK